MNDCQDFECTAMDPMSDQCQHCDCTEKIICLPETDKKCCMCTHYDCNADECEFEHLYVGEKPVLDATCGSRMIWFNKENELAVYVDQREMDHKEIWTSGNGLGTRYCTIHTDVVASFTNLPFPDESFWHVIFDPPHLKTVSDNAWMYLKYGRLPKEWEPVIRDGFAECWRVLKPHGTLIFKWNECQILVKEIIKCIGHEPLYGCRSGRQSNTHWMAFIKEPEE